MAKSVAKNAFYNGLRAVSNLLFPIITYPYATRHLLATNLGKVDFVSSVISYFVLIAGLGISTYATREGATYRENKDELNAFAREVFTISVFSTVISYLLLGGLILAWPRLHGYMALLAIQSVSILGPMIGVDWVYSIHEDFGYITLRSVIVQAVSALLLFLLVKTPDDYIVYAGITVFANTGASVFNFVRSRHYVDIKLVWGFDVSRHLIPMLVLFGNAIATTIYVNIDVTLINIFRNDYEVGIYSLAVRVHTILKNLLNSVLVVALPRLSLYLATDRSAEYEELRDSMFEGIIVAVLPIMALFILMADYVVMIMGGDGFVDSIVPLQILCIAIAPAVLGCLIANAILLPNKEERMTLTATVVGAVVNLLTNAVAIPRYGIIGASVTTVIAEFSVLTCLIWASRNHCDLRHMVAILSRPLLSSVLAIIAMAAVSHFLATVVSFNMVGFFVTGFALTLTALIVLLLRRDAVVLRVMSLLRKRLGV